jgi:steroid 5-alpha reductase family enzyme
MKRSGIDNKAASLLIVLLTYIIAAAAGYLVYFLSSGMHLIISVLLADIAATIVVWLSGILFKNSSLYDPYWSVIPFFIIIFWAFVKGITYSVTDILLVVVVFVWGARLTINWILRWKGMSHQDWRYTMLKNRAPSMWFFTNLFGINMIPTLIVFIALVPAYYTLGSSRNALFAIPGFIVCIFAVTIQAVSDRQMDLFKRNPSNKGKLIDCGLWKYSRHPNYLGEISFWWGIWLMQAWAAPGNWWTVAGPVLMTMLFIFLSIPMMEQHILETRPEYKEYQRNVSVLKFLPRKST